MAQNIPTWPGSSSFFPGDTPFGFYDNDPEFQCEADPLADWAAKRLGWPLTSIELQSKNFYTAFEEAVTEYGNQVNTYAARDNLIHLLGLDTGSVNYTGRYIPPTLRSVVQLSKQYGTEAGTGGRLTYYSGSINISQGKQVYDFLNLNDVTLETGSFSSDAFTIRKVFHEPIPAIVKYLDPSLGTGIGMQNALQEFGFGSFSVPGNFLVMPLYSDALRMQAIELNDEMRKSAYSFQLTNNRIRIFPIPTHDFKMYFYYTLDHQGLPGQSGTPTNVGTGKISDFSNIPYYNISYRLINDMGKQWIRKYMLALSKEMLGRVRGKYATMPIPDGEVTLNGPELISEAQTEKEGLITQLKEILDQMSRQSQMERKVSESENLQTQLKFVPLKIYIK